MKQELGIARCGLACCLCSENTKCNGCYSDSCPDRTQCENRKCSIEKGLSGCYACEIDCKRGLLSKIKPYGFTLFIKRYGMEKLLDCLEENEKRGIVYHREGIIGDYDDFDGVEELIEFIKTGKRRSPDISELSAKYTVRRLGEGDIESVYQLSLGNPMFYEYCPPMVTRESIRKDMKALPPGVGYEDKFYIGFFKGEKLIAIMDLILNYPDSETVFIGLFMVDKSEQGRGTGSEIVGECLSCAGRQGYRRARLAYAKGNPQSEAFWRKNGFTKTGVESNMGNYTAVIMEKPL